MKTRRIIGLAVLLFVILSGAPVFAAPTQEAVTDDPGQFVTLTFASTYKQPEDPPWGESASWQKLKSDLNLEIEYTYYDPEKFALILASNELADIVVGHQRNLPQILDNNMALNLDPLLEEFASNLLLDPYTIRNEMLRKIGNDGNLYMVSSATGTSDPLTSRGLNIRWDWYKEIGTPAINNDDDYIAALSAIHARHPKTENGDTVYATGLYDRLSTWHTRANFSAGSALNPWVFFGSQYMTDWQTNELYNGYTNTDRSAYWVDMKFYNKLYRMGLLDPDSFTMTSDELNAKTENGQYIAFMGFPHGGLYNTMREKDPNTLAGYIVVPSTNNVYWAGRSSWSGNAPTHYTFISSESDKWQRALALMDYLHDPDNIRMMTVGIQGETWDVDGSGVPFLFDATVQGKTTNSEDYKNSVGAFNFDMGFQMLMGTSLHPDGYKYDLFTDPRYKTSSYSVLEKDYVNHYNAKTVEEPSMDIINSGAAPDMRYDFAQTAAIGIGEVPSDTKRIIEASTDIIYRAIPNLVMAESDQEFEEIRERVLSDIAAAGEDESWTWAQDAYSEAKTSVEAILVK
jgi:hypothetical protein